MFGEHQIVGTGEGGLRWYELMTEIFFNVHTLYEESTWRKVGKSMNIAPQQQQGDADGEKSLEFRPRGRAPKWSVHRHEYPPTSSQWIVQIPNYGVQYDLRKVR